MIGPNPGGERAKEGENDLLRALPGAWCPPLAKAETMHRHSELLFRIQLIKQRLPVENELHVRKRYFRYPCAWNVNALEWIRLASA